MKITLNELRQLVKSVIREEMENNSSKEEKFMGLEIKGDKIYGYEPYFDKNVWVASINHDREEVTPTHGYFYPHKIGKKTKKYAEKIGYTFNNN
jgi:hypothetical protein